MSNDDLSGYLEPLKILVKAAGAGILDLYYKSSQLTVRSKPDASPLTEADILAHEIVSAGLKELTPQVPILSEEDSNIPYAVRQQWQRYWLVDPLDGTREFIRHSDEFAISIALIEDQQPIFGVIYNPVTDEIFFAIKGQGAFKQEPQQPPRQIHVRAFFPEKIGVTLGNYYKLVKIKSILAHFVSYEIIHLGSALKFCLIAEGRADLYPRFGITYEWDTAAGQIIVEEAGGAVVDTDFKPLRYNSKESLLNPHFFAMGDAEKLIEQLNGVLDFRVD